MGLAGIDGERTIMLKNRAGKDWKMGLRRDKVPNGKYCLSSGWGNFKRIHNLSKGDKCVFKYIKSEDKLCLVKVYRKNRSSGENLVTGVPLHGHDGGGDDDDDVEDEKDSVEVVKKRRGRPRKHPY